MVGCVVCGRARADYCCSNRDCELARQELCARCVTARQTPLKEWLFNRALAIVAALIAMVAAKSIGGLPLAVAAGFLAAAAWMLIRGLQPHQPESFRCPACGGEVERVG